MAGVYRIGTAIIDYSTMKRILIILLAAALLTTPVLLGQVAQPGVLYTDPSSATPDKNLVKFDLDFPGGTPRQLVEAINKASGKPLNAIIPDESANIKLPPL